MKPETKQTLIDSAKRALGHLKYMRIDTDTFHRAELVRDLEAAIIKAESEAQ